MMDKEKFEALVTQFHTNLTADAGLEFQVVTAVMMVVFTDGSKRLLNIQEIANEQDVSPADVVQGLKKSFKADPSVYGIILPYEAWALKHDKNDSDPEFKRDLERINKGEMRIADSKFRVDTLHVTGESRAGFFRMYNHEINRKAGFMVLSDADVLSERADIKGKLCGIFK